jgi:hypothetical protein
LVASSGRDDFNLYGDLFYDSVYAGSAPKEKSSFIYSSHLAKNDAKGREASRPFLF